MALLSTRYYKTVIIEPNGDLGASLKWILRNEGPGEIRGLFRYSLQALWQTQNLRDLQYDEHTVEVHKTVTGDKSKLELTPLKDSLPAREECEIELSFKSSDIVDQFSQIQMFLFRDINRLADIPDIPTMVIDSVTYPGFSTSKSVDYECTVEVPNVRRLRWMKFVVDEWNRGTGHPKKVRKNGKQTLLYKFTLPVQSTKEYGVVYGLQPRGVPGIVSAIALMFVVFAGIASLIIAWGIGFNGVDPKEGGVIIGGLIGGEVALKWITRAGKFGSR